MASVQAQGQERGPAPGDPGTRAGLTPDVIGSTGGTFCRSLGPGLRSQEQGSDGEGTGFRKQRGQSRWEHGRGGSGDEEEGRSEVPRCPSLGPSPVG